MSYRGYIPFMINFCMKRYQQTRKPISILEIGVQEGVTTLTIASHLAFRKVEFQFDAVDICLQNHVSRLADHLLMNSSANLNLVEQNSLTFLDELKDKVYDLVLIDGDHNYYTISNECSKLKPFINEHTLLMFDDYDGKWSNKDLYYQRDRDGYQEIESATTPQGTSKQGVKPAVDEFVDEMKLLKGRIGTLGGSPVFVATPHLMEWISKELLGLSEHQIKREDPKT